MGVSAPVSSCMHEEQKTERERRDGQPRHLPRANGTGRSSPNAFASLRVVVTGFVVIIFLLVKY